MAKKLYHLPLQRIRTFLTEHKSTLGSTLKNSKKLEYTKRFGKACYLLEVERFICFLKIEKNLDHALKLITYFESEAFMRELMELLELKSFCEPKREYLYGVLHYLQEHEPKLFSSFLQQSFMHYHTSQTPSPKKDPQTLATALAKSKKIAFKESFGEEEGKAYFRIVVEGVVVVEKRGKSIRRVEKRGLWRLVRDAVGGDCYRTIL